MQYLASGRSGENEKAGAQCHGATPGDRTLTAWSWRARLPHPPWLLRTRPLRSRSQMRSFTASLVIDEMPTKRSPCLSPRRTSAHGEMGSLIQSRSFKPPQPLRAQCGYCCNSLGPLTHQVHSWETRADVQNNMYVGRYNSKAKESVHMSINGGSLINHDLSTL